MLETRVQGAAVEAKVRCKACGASWTWSNVPEALSRTAWNVLLATTVMISGIVPMRVWRYGTEGSLKYMMCHVVFVKAK